MNITEPTKEENNAGIRIQVRSRLKQVLQVKQDLPKAIEQLKGQLANPMVKEAFGDEFPVLEKIINTL